MADTNIDQLAAEVASLEGQELADHPRVQDLTPPQRTELVKAIGAFHEAKARRALTG